MEKHRANTQSGLVTRIWFFCIFRVEDTWSLKSEEKRYEDSLSSHSVSFYVCVNQWKFRLNRSLKQFAKQARARFFGVWDRKTCVGAWQKRRTLWITVRKLTWDAEIWEQPRSCPKTQMRGGNCKIKKGKRLISKDIPSRLPNIPPCMLSWVCSIWGCCPSRIFPRMHEKLDSS